MKNEVMKKEQTELATSAPPTSIAGIVPTDVLVPRMLLMQGTSDFVKERKATLGDICRSTNAEKLGDPDTQIEFIPLTAPNATWIKEKRIKGAQRWEFSGVEPRGAQNDGLPWKYNADKDGKLLPDEAPSSHEWRRVKCLTLYGLLPQDIDAFQKELDGVADGGFPDLSKALTPILITFRSTSFNAGKEVSTFFTQAAQFRKEGYEYTLKLGCYLDQNDQGSYYVYSVDRSKPTAVKPEHRQFVKDWVQIVATTKLNIDETGEEVESAPVPVTANNF